MAKKLKKDIKWNTYVDANLDSSLKKFMKTHNITNQARLIRNSVKTYIELVEYLNQIKTDLPNYDAKRISSLFRKALEEFNPESNLFGDLKQKISPIKTSLLILEDSSNKSPKDLKPAINNAKDALEELEMFVKSYFESPSPTRFVSEFDILYIEDNELDRNVIEDYLEEKGYEVKAVESSNEALDILKYSTPKIILSDVFLQTSKLNGDKLCKILKGKEQYENIPFYLISALITDKEKDVLLAKSGADGIIFKPMSSLEDLEVILNKLK